MRVHVTGASGVLGPYVLAALNKSGFLGVGSSLSFNGNFGGTSITPMDFCDRDQVRYFFTSQPADGLIHLGALARVGDCFSRPELAKRVNDEGAGIIAEEFRRSSSGIAIMVSTDMVFNGSSPPYDELSETLPLSIYGKTKLAGEQSFFRGGGDCVVRLGLLFGKSLLRHLSFFDTQLLAMQQGHVLKLFTDEYRTPISVFSVAQVLVGLLESHHRGLFVLGGEQRVSRYDFGVLLAETAGLSSEPLLKTLQNDAQCIENRPRDLSLDSSKLRRIFPAILNGGLKEEISKVLSF